MGKRNNKSDSDVPDYKRAEKLSKKIDKKIKYLGNSSVLDNCDNVDLYYFYRYLVDRGEFKIIYGMDDMAVSDEVAATRSVVARNVALETINTCLQSNNCNPSEKDWKKIRMMCERWEVVDDVDLKGSFKTFLSANSLSDARELKSRYDHMVSMMISSDGCVHKEDDMAKALVSVSISLFKQRSQKCSSFDQLDDLEYEFNIEPLFGEECKGLYGVSFKRLIDEESENAVLSKWGHFEESVAKKYSTTEIVASMKARAEQIVATRYEGHATITQILDQHKRILDAMGIVNGNASITANMGDSARAAVLSTIITRREISKEEFGLIPMIGISDVTLLMMMNRGLSSDQNKESFIRKTNETAANLMEYVYSVSSSAPVVDTIHYLIKKKYIHTHSESDLRWWLDYFTEADYFTNPRELSSTYHIDAICSAYRVYISGFDDGQLLELIDHLDGLNKNNDVNGSIAELVAHLYLKLGESNKDIDPSKALEYLERATPWERDLPRLISILNLAGKAIDEGALDDAKGYVAVIAGFDSKYEPIVSAIQSYLDGGISKEEQMNSLFLSSIGSFFSAEEMESDCWLIALDYLAAIACRGNCRVLDIDGGSIDTSRMLATEAVEKSFFRSYIHFCIGAKKLLSYDFVSGIEDFSTALGIAGVSRFDGILFKMATLGKKAIDWFCSGNGSSSAVKDEADALFKDTTWSMGKWFAKCIRGFAEEWDANPSFALREYGNAMEYTFDLDWLAEKKAVQHIKLGNYRSAAELLEDRTDAISTLMCMESRLLGYHDGDNSDYRRPHVFVRRMGFDNPYEEAYSHKLCGLEYASNTPADAIKEYGKGLEILGDSNTLRDLLLKVDLLVGTGDSKYALSTLKESYDEEVNKYYNQALDLLTPLKGLKHVSNLFDGISNKLKGPEDFNRFSSQNRATPKSDSIEYATITLEEGMQVDIQSPEIGSGGTYKVYRAKDRMDGAVYALRMRKGDNPFKNTTTGFVDKDGSFVDEVNTWIDLSDSFGDVVVKYIGRALTPNPVVLMEWADGNLLDRLSRMSRRDILGAMVFVLRGLQRLHDEGFVHNDFKPDNILLFGTAWKLSDFDKTFLMNYPGANIYGGTYQFNSPEKVNRGEVTTKSDIWAAGVTLYKLLCNAYPFGNGDPNTYGQAVCEGQYNRGIIPPGFAELFERVFSLDPDARPTASEMADEIEKMI